MRTIKFRAWHKELKQMFWFDLMCGSLHNKGTGWIGMLPIEQKERERNSFIGSDDRIAIDPNSCELMQFTGLQDKNGADIYEGDILDGDGIVEWNDVEFCWSVKDKGYDGVDQWHYLQFKNCPIEITGNIHEGGINVL